MNKVVVGIVAVVVVVGAVVLLTKNGSEENGEVVMEDAETISLRNLIDSRSAERCEFSTVTDTSESSGVVYLGEGSARGDFVSTSMGATFNSHMIVLGEEIYVWQDGDSQGFRMDVAMTESPEENSPAADFNKQVEYECEDWNVESSRFELPDGVEFRSLAEVFEGAVEASGSVNVTGTAEQCAACENLPEGAQEQCRVALSCQ